MDEGANDYGFVRFARRWHLWLILLLIAALLTAPFASAQSDDWIVIQFAKVEVRNGSGHLKLMMVAPHGTDYSGSYTFPSEGTAQVGPGGSVPIGGGIAVRKLDRSALPVYISGITSNQPSPLIEQNFNLISGFISNLLSSRLVDILRINPEFLWGWIASTALDMGFHAVYEAMVINPELDHGLLLLNADNGWLADGQQHTLSSANGHFVFTYEVRIAHQSTPPPGTSNTPAGTGISVINDSGRDVCKLFIVSRRAMTWGDNLLGTPLSPGASASLAATTGELKFRAKDCNDNTVAEDGKLTLRPGQTLHIRAKR